jgi:hypothetical protein
MIFAQSFIVARLPVIFRVGTRSKPLLSIRETALSFGLILGAVFRGVLCTRLALVTGFSVHYGSG